MSQDKIRPEKRPMNGYEGFGDKDNNCKTCEHHLIECVCEGYNQACDDWTAWLPTESEIKEILVENGYKFANDKVAKAIIGRLHK